MTGVQNHVHGGVIRLTDSRSSFRLVSVGRRTEQDQVNDVETRLREKFPSLPSEHVTAAVSDAHKHFVTSTVRDYIALLVERRAVANLQPRFDGRG